MTLTPTDLRPGSGDQLIIYDTARNFEWLNLTATCNHSYLEILNGFGGFIGSMGFRIAEGGEINNLFQAAGVTKFSGPEQTEDLQNTKAIEVLLDLLGGRCFNGSQEYSQGYQYEGCGSVASVQGLFLDRIDNPNSQAYADGGYGDFHGNVAYPDVGAYLVRERAELPCQRKKENK